MSARSGYRLGEAKHEDIFALVGMKPRASAAAARGDLHVVDTSALIDGRVADLVATGFVSGTILLHDGVLRELQAISDSSDTQPPHARTSGARRPGGAAEGARPSSSSWWRRLGVIDVDAALVRLARERGASLITVDHNLAKVAEALRVPVAQINALASKFRVPYTAGDEIAVRLVKEGREHGQGVGYLDDGTMVVVEKADEHIGDHRGGQGDERDPDHDGPDGVRRPRRPSQPPLDRSAPRRLPCLPHGTDPASRARPPSCSPPAPAGDWAPTTPRPSSRSATGRCSPSPPRPPRPRPRSTSSS